MRYLIDGNNLLHAVGQHGAGPPPGRQGLCKLVAAWARRSAVGAEVTLVFDGPAPRTGLARQFERPGISVRFSGSESADAVIEGEVARAAAPAEITVVTTDRAIQHEVRYRRARTIDSEAFAAELYVRPEVESRQPAAPPEKPDQVSFEEARDWVERFNDGLEDTSEFWPWSTS